jgi:cyanophycinase
MRGLLLTICLLTLPLHAELTRYYTGNDADMKPPVLRGPLLVLTGGGGDVTAGLQDAIDRIRSCTGAQCRNKIDVVVIRASGADGYNPYFMAMNGVDSVLSMVITDRDSAMRPDVAAAVREAEFVYFAGGDQCNYIRWIKGTPVAEAVKSVYKRRGIVGGTSAGLAIMGEIAYDACPSQSARSTDVLADPFHADVSLSRGFFEWPGMRGVITDTHFQQRDRLGRLLVFLARSSAGKPLTGLGVSEGTIALVDDRGAGIVMGKGPVHMIAADTAPQRVERGQPLEYRGLRIWRFEPGETFDLQTRPLRAPTKTIDVVGGKLSGDPY